MGATIYFDSSQATQEQTLPSETFFCACPKAELHLHFEGAVPIGDRLELMRKYDPALGAQRGHTLSKPPTFPGRFRDFVSLWRWQNSFMRSVEDIEFAAEGCARSIAADGIVYAEIHFSPSGFLRRGFNIVELACAIRNGLNRGSKHGGRLQLIVDLVRDEGPVFGRRLLDAIAEVAKDVGLVAVGLGGDEAGFGIDGYGEIFDCAERIGLRRVAHAGEALGPPSIWAALTTLRPERIGHGTRCIEEDALVAHLQRCELPLEMCVTSNVALGVTPRLIEHPLSRLLDKGLYITLSSDDPALFHTTLSREFAIAHDILHVPLPDLQLCARRAFEAAFLVESEKTRYLRLFDSYWLQQGERSHAP
jgi:adenosine deaminase